MNIELSIYKIKNYAYAYGFFTISAVTSLLGKIYNYSPAEYIAVAAVLFLLTITPVWLEVRKLEKHFKQ